MTETIKDDTPEAPKSDMIVTAAARTLVAERLKEEGLRDSLDVRGFYHMPVDGSIADGELVVYEYGTRNPVVDVIVLPTDTPEGVTENVMAQLKKTLPTNADDIVSQ